MRQRRRHGAGFVQQIELENDDDIVAVQEAD